MTNQQLIDSGNRMMDETDEAIERSKKVSLCLKGNWLLPRSCFLCAFCFYVIPLKIVVLYSRMPN